MCSFPNRNMQNSFRRDSEFGGEIETSQVFLARFSRNLSVFFTALRHDNPFNE